MVKYKKKVISLAILCWHKMVNKIAIKSCYFILFYFLYILYNGS